MTKASIKANAPQLKAVAKVAHYNPEDIEIESNIPIAVRASGGYIKSWPIEKLEVGQSFFVPLPEGGVEDSMRQSLGEYCHKKGAELNRHFKSVDETKNGMIGYRIHRLAGSYVPKAKRERRAAEDQRAA